MAKSILQTEKECYVTRSTYNLHLHHVIPGNGTRKLCDKYGLTVWLRADWHNMSDYGVHFNKKLDTELKQMAQKKAMEVYGWSVEDFIKIFGQNYL